MYKLEFGTVYIEVVEYFSLVETGPFVLWKGIRLPYSELYMFLGELNTETILLQCEFSFVCV